MNDESLAIWRSEDDCFRSAFVRDLIRRPVDTRFAVGSARTSVPRTIVQFWDTPADVPADVRACMETWDGLCNEGFSVARFDEFSARNFVGDNLDSRHVHAFDACYHPAMRSDYFRLCYIAVRGGCYVDADDIYRGNSPSVLFDDGRLKVHPLCYDISSGGMVPSEIFISRNTDTQHWIYYFNNNPLIAPPGHPVVIRALRRATNLLNRDAPEEFPDIQSTTGPGNLTASVVAEALIAAENNTGLALMVLSDWEQIASTVWSLSYRADARNWRLANRRRFLR